MLRQLFALLTIWCFACGSLVAFGATPERSRSLIISIQSGLKAYHSEFRDFDPVSGFPTGPTLFEGLDPASVRFSSGAGSASLVGIGSPGNQALAGTLGGVPDLSRPITLTFTEPRNYVLFDVLDLGPGTSETVQLTAYFADAALPPEVFTHQDDDNDPSTPLFFGVGSVEPISAVEIAPLSTLAIDNLYLVTAIPEPAALAMIAPLLMVMHRRGSR